ncbi:hypothetical protein OB2597_00915 [Pseudooceanicola batsensis HTCC2597]|uniref:Uncharacterized protein n=1 Tax=Pseudooceanicola batsensis (strain ATCC BAA-863 / DSM 15984 / KCTC 12145 / HTCC2597) TaxID=252305 RepID=A3U200_PSEBH|nr:hypothetical protein OB2597_00915 [Pseudooceanicola batsensis HTCC2597]
MARRRFYLAKYAASRIGDTHQLGPKNIKLRKGRPYNGWQPAKKGAKPVEVPVRVKLVEELDAGGMLTPSCSARKGHPSRPRRA